MVNIICSVTGEVVMTITLAEFEEFGITVEGFHAEVIHYA